MGTDHYFTLRLCLRHGDRSLFYFEVVSETWGPIIILLRSCVGDMGTGHYFTSGFLSSEKGPVIWSWYLEEFLP